LGVHTSISSTLSSTLPSDSVVSLLGRVVVVSVPVVGMVVVGVVVVVVGVVGVAEDEVVVVVVATAFAFGIVAVFAVGGLVEEWYVFVRLEWCARELGNKCLGDGDVALRCFGSSIVNRTLEIVNWRELLSPDNL
jgi:hypothetical protein